MTEFEPITNPTMIHTSRRSMKVTVVRSGVWKFRPHSGGVGRAGKRKEQGHRKGMGLAGGPTPPKVLARRGQKKEEK